MTLFERSLSKLSENHKIVEMVSTEFMAAERVPEPLIKQRGGGIHECPVIVGYIEY